MASGENNERMRLTAVGDREIVISRVFDAPQTTLFETLTEPAHLKKWFGAFGWSVEECELDLKQNGKWHSVLTGPYGWKVGLHGSYLEVDRPDKLVHTTAFDCTPGQSTATTLLIEEDGKTTLKGTILYESKLVRDSVLFCGLEYSAAECHEKLAAYLAEIQK